MAEIGAGSVYDWVKKEKEAAGPTPQNQLDEDLSNIGIWFSVFQNPKYFMLLNNEINDYTVFNFVNMNFEKAVQELKECIEWRGRLHSVDYNSKQDYYEIWLYPIDEEELRMYLLFPCDTFIIEIE